MRTDTWGSEPSSGTALHGHVSEVIADARPPPAGSELGFVLDLNATPYNLPPASAAEGVQVSRDTIATDLVPTPLGIMDGFPQGQSQHCIKVLNSTCSCYVCT